VNKDNNLRAIILMVCAFLIACPIARAQEVFRNPAMEQDDEFSRTLNEGRKLARQRRAEEAITVLRKAAAMREGNCSECFFLIGQIYFQSRMYKEAAASYRKAADLKPANEADIYNALGVAHYLRNDRQGYVEAAVALNRAIELSNGRIVMAYYNLGFALIKQGKQDEGVAALKKFLELKTDSPYAAQVRAIIADPRLVDAKFAPAFKVRTLKGEELSLDTLKGKIVLLDFWATWCGPCRVEMPAVKKMWQKYSAEPFVIVGISLDRNPASLNSYIAAEGIEWPQYHDRAGQISNLYGVNAIPQTFLIDQHGIIREVGLRGGSLANKIGELLKKLQK
jgi:peroxiredoxin/Tfp pilus assembly protein PilF